MILVDTNVISEIMKGAPSEVVLDWLNDQKSTDLYISAITIGEIEYGLRILPTGLPENDKCSSKTGSSGSLRSLLLSAS